MKNIAVILLITALASIMTIAQTSAFPVQDKRQSGSEFGERDETHQTFKLVPGAQVDMSSIRGTVEIDMADIEVAEIHITRSAQSRDALAQYKISIEHKPQSLSIHGEQRQSNSGAGFGADVRHQVKMRLPRHVDLSVRSVSGDVRILGDISGHLAVSSVSGMLSAGAVSGRVEVSSVSGSTIIGDVSQQVDIKSVSGNLTVGQAVGSLNVSGVSGNVFAGVAKIGPRGIQVKNISGQVELRFRDELNAQLKTSHISGKLYLDVPNVTMQSKAGASAVNAQIGTGTHPISIDNISSDVRLTQGT